MHKLFYAALGILVLSATALMVTAAPVQRRTSEIAQGSIDIRSLEQTLDLKALPSSALDPAIYR